MTLLRNVRLVLTSAAMALLLASNAAMARDLPLLGGPGGGAMNLRCPAGQHLVGFQAKSGLWVDAITIQCSGLVQVSERVRHTGISPGGSAGGGGGGLGPVTNCQEGTAVGSIGVHIFSDRTKMVRDINFGCVNQTVSGGGTRAVGNATTGTFPTTQSCARGEAAVGVNTRSGAYVDAIGLICDPINVKQAGPDNTDLCNAYADRMMKRVAEAKQLNCRGWAFETTRAGNLKRCLSYGAKAAETITFNEGPFDAVLKACKAGPGPGPTTRALTAEQQQMLDLHNGHRRTCGVPTLSWSWDVADSAQTWANGCHESLKTPSSFCHQNNEEDCGKFPKSTYGENLHWGESATPQSADNGWYASEITNYDFKNPVYTNKVGHFTQMVWRASTQLGCAKSVCSGKTLWVCRYSEPGNWNVVPGRLFTPPQPRPTDAEAQATLRANVSDTCK